jgi:hypothetical protein
MELVDILRYPEEGRKFRFDDGGAIVPVGTGVFTSPL